MRIICPQRAIYPPNLALIAPHMPGYRPQTGMTVSPHMRSARLIGQCREDLGSVMDWPAPQRQPLGQPASCARNGACAASGQRDRLALRGAILQRPEDPPLAQPQHVAAAHQPIVGRAALGRELAGLAELAHPSDGLPYQLRGARCSDSPLPDLARSAGTELLAQPRDELPLWCAQALPMLQGLQGLRMGRGALFPLLYLLPGQLSLLRWRCTWLRHLLQVDTFRPASASPKAGLDSPRYRRIEKRDHLSQSLIVDLRQLAQRDVHLAQHVIKIHAAGRPAEQSPVLPRQPLGAWQEVEHDRLICHDPAPFLIRDKSPLATIDPAA